MLGTWRMRYEPRRWSVPCCLVLMVSGCDRPEPGAEGVPEARNPAGATRTLDASPTDLPAWSVGDPELAIPGDGANGGPFLEEITDASFLSDGRVLVVDAGSRHLHVFDSSGELQTTLGGPGEGPGEFSRLALLRLRLVSAGVGDTVSAYDPARATLHVFHPREGFVRSERREAPTDGSRRFAVWQLGPNRRVEYLRRVDPEPTGEPVRDFRRRGSTGLVVYDDEGDDAPPDSVRFEGAYTAVGEVGEMVLPFSHQPAVDVRNGMVAVAPGQEFRVMVFDSTFRRRLDVRWPAAEEPLTEAELGEVAERYGMSGRSAVASMPGAVMFSDELLPPRRPAISRVFVDDEHRIWAARFEPRGGLRHERRWYVLSPQGDPLGVLEMPRRASLHGVRDGRALMVQRDELDVPTVFVAPLGTLRR